MNELALFAGAGGGILGAHLLGWRTVCAVEKEPYCREVLLRRQRDGVLPLFPIWDDCNTFDGNPWSGIVDVVTAGFPCQPFSVAGKQAAGDDERNGWPATLRIISEVGPRFVLLENVPGLLSAGHGYFGQVLSGLAEIGYDAVWDCFPASAIGAPHERDRLWVLAYTNSIERQSGSPALGRQTTAHIPTDTDSAATAQRGEHAIDAQAGKGGEDHQRRGRNDRRQGCVSGAGESQGRDVEDAHGTQCEGGRLPFRTRAQHANTGSAGWWQAEPAVDRVVDGLAHRMDRLKALGNGQVASVVPFAWHQLKAKAGF